MKKIIILITLILIVLSGIFILNTSNANININEANLYSKGEFTDLLRYGSINILCNFVVYEKDGIEYPAYCMQRDLAGVSKGSSYTVKTEELLTNNAVWKIITNGYPYKTFEELGCSNKEQAYLATKQAVYCALYNRDVNEYSGIGEEGEKCFNALKQIVNVATSTNTSKISPDIKINTASKKWDIDILNKNCVSKTFEISSLASMNQYEIILEGELPEGTKITDEQNNEKDIFSYGDKFKIIMPITNIVQDGNFLIKVQGKVNTKPILYGKAENSNKQDYALTGITYEEGIGEQREYYAKNESKIKIVKQENETKTLLEGVKFQLLNENQEVVYSDLTTNSAGEILIENLTPSTYYIKETSTLNGYVLYDKLIKVTLMLNETVNITINNSKTQETNIVVEKPTTNIEVEQKQSEIEIKSPKPKLPKTGM